MAPDKSLAAEIEAKAIKAQSGLLRAHELLAEKYSTWSPEAGTQFPERYPAEAVEGIRLARELLAEIAALQSRAFEDGARWMRESAAEACGEEGSFHVSPADDLSAQYASACVACHDLVAALPLQPEGERNA